MPQAATASVARFRPDQGPSVGADERAAFVEELSQASESALVEGLLHLLRRRDEPRCRATLIALLERAPSERLALILVENDKHGFLGPDLTRGLWSIVSTSLSHARLWPLVCAFAQLHAPADRARAFESILGRLDAGRLADLVAARFDEAELRVYWVIFPEVLRRELVRRGRCRPWEPRRAEARHEPRSGRRARPRCSARDRVRPGCGQGAAGEPEADGPEQDARRALRLMVRVFGFRESMSYNEARQRYWWLARQWHPDRAGSSPSGEERIRELNQAWAVAKACFAGGRS